MLRYLSGLEKYPRGRRGSPAKGVGGVEPRSGSNPDFSANKAAPPPQGGGAVHIRRVTEAGTFASAAGGGRSEQKGVAAVEILRAGGERKISGTATRGRLRAPPGAEEASKKEWPRSKSCERTASKRFRAPQQDITGRPQRIRQFYIIVDLPIGSSHIRRVTEAVITGRS